VHAWIVAVWNRERDVGSWRKPSQPWQGRGRRPILEAGGWGTLFPRRRSSASLAPRHRARTVAVSCRSRLDCSSTPPGSRASKSTEKGGARCRPCRSWLGRGRRRPSMEKADALPSVVATCSGNMAWAVADYCRSPFPTGCSSTIPRVSVANYCPRRGRGRELERWACERERHGGGLVDVWYCRVRVVQCASSYLLCESPSEAVSANRLTERPPITHRTSTTPKCLRAHQTPGSLELLEDY
jgi:hypothetical protein